MRPNYLPVASSSELTRITALPVQAYDEEASKDLARAWSKDFLNADGQKLWDYAHTLPPYKRDEVLKTNSISLLPEQADMLRNFIEAQGIVALAPVGTGKTLPLYLAVYIANRWFGKQRVVILVPANILDKTRSDFRELSRYWVAPQFPAQIKTFSALSRPDAAGMLDKLSPDCLLCDEADLLRNPSTTTKRVVRYGTRNLERCIFGFFTGTGMRHSIKNLTHLSALALKHGSPFPVGYTTIEEWSQALDSKVSFRRPPGALGVFDAGSGGDLDEQLTRVQLGFAQRLADTPGFCAYEKQSTDQPLYLTVIAPPTDPVIDEAFFAFRRDDETPDGWACSDVFSYMRFGTELGCGFYKRWDPRPPQYWIDHRNAEARFIRDKIKATARAPNPLDSDARVRRAYPTAAEVVQWQETKPTFTPNSVAVPLSGSTAAFVVEWMRRAGPALVWVTHTWLGQTIAQMARCGYYAGGGKSANGNSIADLDPSCSAVLSANANRRGRNLQGWSRALVVGPEHSAERWEQMLGRIHRQNQKRACRVDILLTSAESIQALDAACKEAQHAKTMTSLPQKLLAADWTWSVAPEILNPTLDSPGRARWFVPE